MTDRNSTTQYHSCPQCGKPVMIEENAACRPFCSMRCKLIDLGGWLSERYVVSEEGAPPDEDTTSEDCK